MKSDVDQVYGQGILRRQLVSAHQGAVEAPRLKRNVASPRVSLALIGCTLVWWRIDIFSSRLHGCFTEGVAQCLAHMGRG